MLQGLNGEETVEQTLVEEEERRKGRAEPLAALQGREQPQSQEFFAFVLKFS